MDWHKRFLQQASWTRDLRLYLFEQAGLTQASRVLEVGCGTGAIISSLETSATIHGLDLEFSHLSEARIHSASAALICGNALDLPYPCGVFDITFCHYLLLWVSDPQRVLLEMRRVTRSGGAVLALAEPDYISRVDKPDALVPLGYWQTESLRKQGADPGIGSQLEVLFRKAGIPPIETGPLQYSSDFSTRHGEDRYLKTLKDRELEWAVLEEDITGWIPAKEIQRLKILDEEAWERGERVLHVPTYFAWGKV